MAVSLAFGVVVATTITLLLVPSLYLIVEDFFEWGGLKQKTLESEAAQHNQQLPVSDKS